MKTCCPCCCSRSISANFWQQLLFTTHSRFFFLVIRSFLITWNSFLPLVSSYVKEDDWLWIQIKFYDRLKTPSTETWQDGWARFTVKIWAIHLLFKVCHRTEWAHLPGIANLHHGVLGFFLWYVFRTLGLLQLLLPGSLALRAVWLSALRWWLRPGAAQGGSRGGVQPETRTHRRSLPPLRENPPAWSKIRTWAK